MKKQLLFILMMMPMLACAAVKVDKIYYNLYSKIKQAEVAVNPYKYSGAVVIPDSFTYEGVNYSVTSIGEDAFFGCTGLTSITIPNSVTAIKSGFYLCSSLTSVRISDLESWCKISFSGNPLSYAHHLYLNGKEIKDLVIPVGVTSISNSAFYGCSGLTSVTIPNSVSSIGEYTFTNCTGLTSVVIPNSIYGISTSVFQGCTGLKSVTIPNSVTSLGAWSFQGCTGLKSVTIPNSVKRIDFKAFDGCSGLTSITIGNGVNEIFSGAFASCPDLTDVYCYAEQAPSTVSDAFEGSYIEFATLHVSAESVDAYSKVDPWKKFKNIVAIDSETPEPPISHKCEKPTISYENGQLKMRCATEGVEYVTEITDADIKKHYVPIIPLAATYNISVYATKTGYENSEIATATLCWIESEPKVEGITTDVVAQIPSKAILMQSKGGVLTVQGADDNTQVGVYNIDGKLAGESISRNGFAEVSTALQPGSVAIVKIGQKSVKIMMK